MRWEGRGGRRRSSEGKGRGERAEEVKEAFPVTHFDIITRCVTHYSHLQCYVTSYCTLITRRTRE